MSEPMIRVERQSEVSPGVFAFSFVFGSTKQAGKSRQPLLDACRLAKSMGAGPGQEIGLNEPNVGRIGFRKYQPFGIQTLEAAE